MGGVGWGGGETKCCYADILRALCCSVCAAGGVVRGLFCFS